MAGFAAEVWVLCLIAFLIGSGVTWLLFVRPLRARAAPPPPAPAADDPAPTPPRSTPDPQSGPPAPPAVDPALSALHGAQRPEQRPGRRAAGALDLLGVDREPRDGARPG